MRQVLGSLQGVVGLGIDEETAIIVRNGEFTVEGNSGVVVYLSPIGGPVSIARILAAGGKGDIAALTASAGAAPSATLVASRGL
jgi:hypothetical protein